MTGEHLESRSTFVRGVEPSSIKQMQINDKVTLISFLGTLTSDEPVNSNENYWKLIGQSGQIIEQGKERVLVKFNCDIDTFQLENHNPVKDSLWILRTDIQNA